MKIIIGLITPYNFVLMQITIRNIKITNDKELSRITSVG